MTSNVVTEISAGGAGSVMAVPANITNVSASVCIAVVSTSFLPQTHTNNKYTRMHAFH